MFTYPTRWFEIYRAKDGWRWRLKAGNGRNIACGGESFVSRRNARDSVYRVIESVPQAGITYKGERQT